MKEVKDISLRELDQLFRAATQAAKDEAVAHGLPVVGLDQKGRPVRLDGDRMTVLAGHKKTVPDPGARTPGARKAKKAAS